MIFFLYVIAHILEQLSLDLDHLVRGPYEENQGFY